LGAEAWNARDLTTILRCGSAKRPVPVDRKQRVWMQGVSVEEKYRVGMLALRAF